MRSLLILILVVFLNNILYAKDYWADTPEEAEEYFRNACAGDRVFLKNGVYKNAAITLINDCGTESAPVFFMAETPGRVYFEGNSMLRIAGKYLGISGFVWRNGGEGLGSRPVIEFRSENKIAEYCVLSDCVIDDYNSGRKENIENKWVSLYGRYNTVTRCLFKNKINRGPTVTVWLDNKEPAYHTISFNYFKIRGNAHNDSNGLETIRIGDSRTSFTEAHCVVAFNRFEDCDGEIEIISNKSCRNSYLHNTFYTNDGGLTLRHGNNCLVSGNFFFGGNKKLSYGVRIIGEGHAVINNYFFALKGGESAGFRSAICIVNGITNSPLNGYFQVRNALIAGNIFVNCPAPVIYSGFNTRQEAQLAPQHVKIQENLFYADFGISGSAYAEATPTETLQLARNFIVGYTVPSKMIGFTKVSRKGIKRNGYKLDGLSDQLSKTFDTIIPVLNKYGSSYISPSISNLMGNRKFSYLTPSDVGPLWLRNLD